MIEKYYTAQEVGEMLAVDAEKVREWIHSGEIEAMNLASSAGGNRPSWRIGAGALCRFLSTRATVTKREKPRKARKPATSTDEAFF